ncbi:hypothetical protein CABS02_02675 [Colletotrichum abscissum]|uniref:Uncharacterized protein n=2 Tax=Colletotrichum acutatum species complex TaxID=2707335 RepID=A0A9P9XNN8_9PEZI|nr:hypothetical protein CABS02_02675 [Colletotrichum abscissum]
MDAHLMSDEEFSRLLSLPSEPYSTLPYGYNLLPSLSASPASQQGDLLRTKSPAFGNAGFLSHHSEQATHGFPPTLPVSYDTSLPLLSDFAMDCQDFQADLGLDAHQRSATNNTFTMEQPTAQGPTGAGSSDFSHTILKMVQAALDKVVASQEEHMKEMAHKQSEQDLQLRVLSDKLDNIRAGLDSFSVDVWRWTRANAHESSRDDAYSSEGYSSMSGVTHNRGSDRSSDTCPGDSI